MKVKLGLEIILLPLLLVALVLYAQLNGLSLQYPSNIRAADPFYHAIASEAIVDTGEWNYYPLWLSQNNEHMVNVLPPLLHMNTAVLSIFSGLPVWSVMYFFVCLVVAISLLFLYLICIEVFEQKLIALLSVALVVLPFNIRAWLYSLYIGFWIQVVGYLFLLAYFWIFLKEWKHHQTWHQILLGIFIAALMVSHPQDVFVLVLPTLLLLIHRWKQTRRFGDVVHTCFRVGIVPIVLFFFLQPRFLYAWSRLGGAGYAITSHSLSYLLSRDYTGSYATPFITRFPLWILLCVAVGFVLMLYNARKHLVWLSALGYFFFLTYVVPFFLSSPHYLLRLRSLTPFFLFPLIAYWVYAVVMRLATMANIPSAVLVVVLCVFIIVFSLPEYGRVKHSVQGVQFIDENVWDAMQWMHTHVPADGRVLFLEGGHQEAALYTKRISATIDNKDFVKKMSQIRQLENGTLVFDPSVPVIWSGATLRESELVADSLWQYHRVQEWNSNVSMLDFDYILFINAAPSIMQFNGMITSSFTQHGYSLAYTNRIIGILARGAP